MKGETGKPVTGLSECQHRTCPTELSFIYAHLHHHWNQLPKSAQLALHHSSSTVSKSATFSTFLKD